jgi:hypothetical protein
MAHGSFLKRGSELQDMSPCGGAGALPVIYTALNFDLLLRLLLPGPAPSPEPPSKHPLPPTQAGHASACLRGLGRRSTLAWHWLPGSGCAGLAAPATVNLELKLELEKAAPTRTAIDIPNRAT